MRMGTIYFGTNRGMCKKCGQYTIEEIRKSIAIDDVSPDLLPFLDRMAEARQKYFDAQLPDYMKLAEDQMIVTKISDKEYSDLYDELYEILAWVFGIGQWDQVKKDTKEVSESIFEYNFDISDVRMEAYINERVGELIKDVDATTQKQVQEIIANAQATGMQFDEVANVINEKFAKYNETRSYLIAKQELRTALEAGRKAQFEEDLSQVGGTEWWKKSYTQEDSAVRETHQIASDAGWISASEPFPGVEKQRPPYDFGCRCTAVYRLWHPDESTVFTP